jgi:DNA-binding SARP family transcriptional activator/regulation of enolase protein 1 (concanavalin A-like superfamily)
VRIARRRVVACAVYLAVTGQEISRDALAAIFWPESDSSYARADLRRTLHLLHQALGPERLVADQERVRFQRDGDLWLDVEHFRRLLSACHDHGHRPQEICPECLSLLAAAAALYRDDFLTGFTLPDSPDFDRWQWYEGEQLRSELASALARLVRGYTAQGEFAHAIAYARRWVALDPLDESALRWLMQVYAWSGERNAALHQYRLCGQLLAQELDAEPEPATQQLEKAIRAGALPPPATAQELGVVGGHSQRGVHSSMAPFGEDELRVVTVLCAGLSLPEQTDDVDALVAQSELLLALTTAACAPYDGRVERVPGGDLLVIFGLHRIHEDDPERAIRAALALQQSALAQHMPVQVGVNTGLAYYSRIGPTADAEALLMGAVVNLAARLCNSAGSGEILVGVATHRLTRGVFNFAGLELALPGLTRPVRAYQVLRLRSHITKERGIEGLRANLIGREREMEQLEAVVARVLAGKGQLLLLSGEAGVGKSRLAAELKQSWRAQTGDHSLPASSSPAPADEPPMSWLEGRCLELAAATGYWPFVDMLRRALSEADDGDEMALARNLAATLEALAAQGDLTAEQVEEMGPVLSHLLSLHIGANWDERARQVDPKRARRQTFDAVQLFVTALARRRPLALIFEDLHWGDGLSLDLIGELMAALASAPLLLVCIYRPEQTQAGEPLLALAQQRCPDRCTPLHLHELSLAQSRDLLAALLSIEQLPDQLRALILAKSQGNPFFLEEIVRAQIDSGLLFRQEAIWQARVETAPLTAPETVQSVVLSRVDRLPPELRRLLQIAAVTGHVFQRPLLAALAPPEIDLEEALVALSSLAFIRQERGGAHVEYSFRHVLVQDAIYQSLPAKRRAPLHQQVAEALETLHAGKLAPHFEQLAYHYERSDAAQKAIEYLVRAGEKAQQASANDEAISYFQRALARLDAIAPQPVWADAAKWRLSALKGLGIVYWSISDLAEAEFHLHRAIAQAHKMGAPRAEWAPLYGWLCRLLRWQGRLDDLILVGREGLAQLGDDMRAPEAAVFYCNLIEAYYLKDDRDHYHDVQRRLAQLMPSLPYSDDLFAAYGYMVLMHRDHNESEEALRWVRAVQEWVEDGHNPLLAAWVPMWQVARYLEAIGDMRTAIAQSEMGLERTRKVGDAKTLAWGLNHQAERYLAVGDLGRAQAVDEESLALHRQLGLEGELMEGTHILAQIRFCQGAVDDALALTEAAMELSHRSGFRYPRGLHGVLLGRIHLAQGRRVEAQARFRAVLETQPTDAQRAVEIYRALAGLEAACAAADDFQALCREVQHQRPELAHMGLQQWWLSPATPDVDLRSETLAALQSDMEQGRWQWVDPLGDCSFSLADDLTIRAANCRDLWGINLSAPRLMQPANGDFAVQVTCHAATADRPAMGGLLLWQDKANYLRLTWGELDAESVALAGSLENRNLVIGRGSLRHEGAITLRLERRGDMVRALCSADEREWFGVGEMTFTAHAAQVVGLHAIGAIDRMVWPGAYPEGTTMRFVIP